MAGAFVLGALEPADAAAVRAHLASCAEAHGEIAELGSVLPILAEGVPAVEPAAELKVRLMAAAAADLDARHVTGSAAGTSAPARGPAGSAAGTSAGAPSAAAPTPAPAPAAGPAPAAAPIAFPTADERAARRVRGSTGGWILRVAAVLAIVALLGWNVLLQVQLGAAQSYEQSVAEVLDVAAQPGSLTAILTADGGSGSGLAAVSAAGAVTIAMQDLAPTSGNAVYQAWVIGSDGVPVPLGSFKVGNAGTASFTTDGLPTASGIVLALTLEPAPGATTPTMPIISKGVATAAG